MVHRLIKHADWLVEIGHYKKRSDAIKMLIEVRQRNIRDAKKELAKVLRRNSGDIAALKHELRAGG